MSHDRAVTPARFTRNPALRWLSARCLAASGWRIEGALPDLPKYVVIGAPHTSNWDFMLMLAVALHFRMAFVWMGKHTLFRAGLGRLFRALGGIPIDRTRSTGVVARAIEVFDSAPRMVMVITPEGTRSAVPAWKRGFYHIARGAGVPIVLGYVDHPRRVVGVGELFRPGDDEAADMAAIQAFYARFPRP